MNQEVETQEVVATKAKASNLPKRVAAVLNLVLADGTKLRAQKYPMPVKAARVPVTINGVDSELAETSFKDKKYTYFLVNDVPFYVTDHIEDKGQALTFEAPEGYEFKALKLDRKAQADAAAAKAKAKKAATAEQAPEGLETGLGSSETAGEGVAIPSDSDAPTAPEFAPRKGKKASR